jgi:putative transposase
MRRSFKYRLCPNATQSRELSAQLETLRRVYNDALAERKDAWELYGAGTKFGDQVKRYQVRRALDAKTDGPRWLARVAAVPVRDTLKRLDKAFQNFFRRVKQGGKAGYPRFRGRDRFDSIPFDNYNAGCALVGPDKKMIAGEMADDAPKNGFKLRIFGVGSVRVKLHRPIAGKIKTVCVKREADKWYVVFSCDLGEVTIEPSKNPPIGIDVGLEHFLTTSDGEHVANPRLLKKELSELRRRQRSLSRKKRGGKNRRKAAKRVARLHARIKNLRRESHYQIALSLVRRYGLVAFEGLAVENMVKNERLARAILDAGWSGFLGILRHKAEEAGVAAVEVDARGTSQQCSACGETVRKDLSVRKHDCPHCGLSLQRDHNAAINILRRAVPETKPARIGPAGRNGSDSPRVPRSSPSARNQLPRAAHSKAAPAKRPKRNRSQSGTQLTLWPEDG